MINRESDSLEQLWGQGAVRVFISHTSEHKVKAKDIQKYLEEYGIASFVAHEDIKPMKEWQNEIESALFSMDLLVALLTERFSESDWTDQEVGVAIGRRVPIVPVRMGKDPYGFIGKHQAIQGSLHSSGIASAVFEYALNENSLRELSTDAYIAAVEKSPSFSSSNDLAKYLPVIDQLSASQEEALVRAYNNNDQVNRAYEWGPYIAGHLKRMTESEYMIERHQLRQVPLQDDLPF